MLKLLIVDDEPLIRTGLKTLINWEAFDFEICGEGENGRDGLNKIRDLHPDLVVADIKMPGMDGLQMIEEVNRLGISCKFIILTGYSEFAYAQKAVELGVDSYVLKPIAPNILMEKVTKMSQVIHEEKKFAETVNESITFSKEKIITKLLTGKVDESFIDHVNRFYDLELPWVSYQVICMEARNTGVQLKPDLALSGMFRDILEGFTEEHNLGYICTIDGVMVLLLRNTCFQSYKSAWDGLRDKIMQEKGCSLVAAVGAEIDDWRDLPRSYQQTRILLEKDFILGHNGVIEFVEPIPPESGSTREGSSDEKLVEEICLAIDVNRNDTIRSLMEAKIAQVMIDQPTETEIKINTTNIYAAVLRRLNEGNEDCKDLLSLKESVITEIHRQSSLQNLHAYILAVFCSLSDEMALKRPDGRMKKMMDYIHRQYDTDIKIETLAQAFNYNSAYLGKLFKSHTGEPFHTYVEKLRMEKAKQLLEEGLKVYQVAGRVGYSDIDYFCNKFKKYTGVSPSAYRKGKCEE